ncbi:hypothetical protein [Pantoea agglomerans]|uniref:hypothetical protein n=1 Tax=Enterobacter agglomerans TaxID=549 RepID=UPI00177FC701|nr:hypothetical protein [Pantoea agglomerans]MBD8260526.1 hypothetical protein [Pantoea agglomerans]
MSEFKGSKSPWLISGESEKWNRIVDANGDLITTCFAMQNEDDANANVIAAAPELLEALQACEKILSEIPLTVDLVEDLLFARAAIAKALGQ